MQDRAGEISASHTTYLADALPSGLDSLPFWFNDYRFCALSEYRTHS